MRYKTPVFFDILLKTNVMCSEKFNLLSNVTPRNLVALVGLIISFPTIKESESLGIILFEQTSKFVLSTFMVNLLSKVHSLIL